TSLKVTCPVAVLLAAGRSSPSDTAPVCAAEVIIGASLAPVMVMVALCATAPPWPSMTLHRRPGRQDRQYVNCRFQPLVERRSMSVRPAAAAADWQAAWDGLAHRPRSARTPRENKVRNS